MPDCFLDTSALMKYYHFELGSDRVIAIVDDPGTVCWIPLRTLDALQLAVALWLRDQGHFDLLLCADARLCEATRREQLPVSNPEIP